MKIRLLVSRATVNGSENRGQEIDLPKDEAIRMIEAGQAEPVREKRTEKAIPAPRGEKAKRS